MVIADVVVHVTVALWLSQMLLWMIKIVSLAIVFSQGMPSPQVPRIPVASFASCLVCLAVALLAAPR